MDKCREMRLKKVLQDALNYFDEPKPSAYARCVEITERLFYKNDAVVVLVMNRRDYLELRAIWHHQNCLTVFDDDLGIARNFQTPHGEVKYIIVDPTVDAMYGYLLAEKQ